MVAGRMRALPVLLLVLGCALLRYAGGWLGARAFAGPASLRGRSAAVARRGLLDSLDMSSVEKMLQDPEKVAALKKQMDEIMADPAKKKAMEDYNAKMQAGVEKLKDDPEMKEFFEDVKANGLEALSKYQSDENILRKFSMAAGGPPGGMPMATPAFKPGDEVIVQGLAKAPELNGKKAMVVPPTAEERKTLEGTDRLVVRMVDSGEQFAVRPSNVRSTAQAADAAVGGSLDDVSMYDPAIQTEAAKLRESGKLDSLQEDPELKPIFEDIKKNGMAALEKYWDDDKLMAKISKAMAT